MAALTRPVLLIGLLLGFGTPAFASGDCAPDGMAAAAEANSIVSAVMVSPGCAAAPESAKTEPLPPTPEAMDEPAIAKASDQQARAVDPTGLENLVSISDQLRAASASIDQRQVVLEAAAQRLEARMAELTAIRDSVASQFHPAPTYDSAQIASLAQLYSNMKPANAAAQMAGLPPDVLLSIADALPPRKLSAIVANLPASQADALTGELTQQLPEAFAPGTLPRVN